MLEICEIFVFLPLLSFVLKLFLCLSIIAVMCICGVEEKFPRIRRTLHRNDYRSCFVFWRCQVQIPAWRLTILTEVSVIFLGASK